MHKMSHSKKKKKKFKQWSRFRDYSEMYGDTFSDI